MFKRLIIVLLVAFCVVLALFPVLVGGLLLCQAAGDGLGETVFRGILIGDLCVLATLVLLLVGTLAVSIAGTGPMGIGNSASDREG